MKKYLIALLVSLFVIPHPCLAIQLEEIWNRYAQRVAPQPESTLPGRLLGVASETRKAAFAASWRYRAVAYELHYEEPAALARSVYSLALHAGDIDTTLPVERFIGGVLGFHYSVRQVCDWLNAVITQSFPGPELDEETLAGLLLQDGVIRLQDGRFRPNGRITHILAAAPGKKRDFAANLRHERLHVFWDENAAFREREQATWSALTGAQQAEAKKALSRYASGNEAQFIEEWAIHRAENSNMTLE